jgi:GNAT superfamily N-acetyltransferase
MSFLLFVFQVLVQLIASKIIISRVNPIHISPIATMCLDEFFDPDVTSQSAYKRERLWICQHLESKSVRPRSFFVAQYVNETLDDGNNAAPVVGFVEIAMSSEYNRWLRKYDGESLSSIRIPFREQRPKISALVVDRHYRRLGIGRLLMTACALQARKWTGNDTEEMFLDVAIDNIVAQSFYRSLGFVSFPSPCSTKDIQDRQEDKNIRPSLEISQDKEAATAAEKVLIMYRRINCDH